MKDAKGWRRRPVRTGRSYVPYVRVQKNKPVRTGRSSGPYVRPGRTGRLHRALVNF